MLTLKANLPKPFEFLGQDIIVFRGLVSPNALKLADEDFVALSFDDRELASNIHYGTSIEHRPEITFAKNEELISELTATALYVAETLTSLYGFLGIEGCTPFRLNRYAGTRGYRSHVDRSNNSDEKAKRAISLVIGVGSRSDYEGGLLSFKRQGVELKLDRGDVLAFPSGYTHPHSVTPVTAGTRRTIVSWMI